MSQMDDCTRAILRRLDVKTPKIGYRDIVRALQTGIADGSLSPDMRLPPQRRLADALGVAIGTVNQAYGEAKRLDLVTAKVGAGTFIRSTKKRAWSPSGTYAAPDIGFVDLTVNAAPDLEQSELDRAFLTGEDSELRKHLLRDQDDEPDFAHQEAGADWVRRSGVVVEPGRIVVCNGVQQALTALFGVLAKPADVCATEDLNYPGAKLLANFLGLQLQGLPMDDEGLRPDALEEACRRRPPKILLCTPTLQNPTTSVMSLERRKDIARVASRYGVTIIEDDLYGCLPEEAPPRISSLGLCDAIYVTGLSKPISRKLRIGYIAAPQRLIGTLTSAIRATSWMVSPLLSHLATKIIFDGTADKIVELHRMRARERIGLASQLLPLGDLPSCKKNSYHVWLRLPRDWRAGTFALEARKRGIAVIPSETFAVNSAVPYEAVRVSLGAARTEDALRVGLAKLASLLELDPRAVSADVA